MLECIFGIDPGRANTGLVRWNNIDKKIDLADTIVMSLSTARKKSQFNPTAYRLEKMRQEFDAFLRSHGDLSGRSLAVIEDYAYGDELSYEDFRKIDRKTLEVGESHGTIYSTLSENHVPYIKVAPTQLKLFVAGDGRADKTVVMKSLYDLYRVPLENDHEYDALACAHVGRYFALYCMYPSSLKEGTYEQMVVSQIAYHKQYESIRHFLHSMIPEPTDG